MTLASIFTSCSLFIFFYQFKHGHASQTTVTLAQTNIIIMPNLLAAPGSLPPWQLKNKLLKLMGHEINRKRLIEVMGK